MFALLFVTVAPSLFVRIRRARGMERQQIKWPAYTAVMAATGSVFTYTIAEAVGAQWLEWTGFVILMAALVCFPISVGIAIVRYRLYEIDLIINRTLVYGSLTATLVATLFRRHRGVAEVLRRSHGPAVHPRSRGFHPPDRRVVHSPQTAHPALYRPSLLPQQIRRCQDPGSFLGQLRNETDLDALSDDLVGVVSETMQPAHVSLWLHPDSLEWQTSLLPASFSYPAVAGTLHRLARARVLNGFRNEPETPTV